MRKLRWLMPVVFTVTCALLSSCASQAGMESSREDVADGILRQLLRDEQSNPAITYVLGSRAETGLAVFEPPPLRELQRCAYCHAESLEKRWREESAAGRYVENKDLLLGGALDSLARLHAKSHLSVSILCEWIGSPDTDPRLREPLARILASSRDPEGFATLLECLFSTDSNLRSAATLILSETYTGAADPVVLRGWARAVGDPSRGVTTQDVMSMALLEEVRAAGLDDLVTPELLRQFVLANASPLLRIPPGLDPAVPVASERIYEADGWIDVEALRKAHGEHAFLLSFSNVGVNLETGFALVYASIFRDALWGGGRFILFKRVKGRWVVFDEFSMSIS